MKIIQLNEKTLFMSTITVLISNMSPTSPFLTENKCQYYLTKYRLDTWMNNFAMGRDITTLHQTFLQPLLVLCSFLQ